MRGIIFSTESVQAILEGRKSQTRREVKEPPDCEIMAYDGKWICNIRSAADDYRTHYINPRYQVGEIVYVKETYTVNNGQYPTDLGYVFKAELGKNELEYSKELGVKWKSPLFMPQSAARIFIEVTGVRCERLGDISEQDCIAEGVISDMFTDHPKGVYYTAYRTLWEKINKSYNPDTWVWAYSFKRIEKYNN